MNCLKTGKPLGESSQAGYATIIMGLLLLSVATIAGISYLQKGTTAVKLAAQESAKLEIAAEFNKILTIAGFLVANGAIACKEKAWESGGGAKTCRYEGKRRTDADLSPENFGLSVLPDKSQGRKLVLNLDPNKIIAKTSTIKIKSATLAFELVDATQDAELNLLLGERPDSVKSIDRDDHLIVATAEIKYTKEKRDYTTSGASAFKRPIAMTRLSISAGSACAGRCNSSLSQNPFPSCRGPQTISDEAVVEINATTTNLGPGLLYDLKYERAVCLKNNLHAVIGADGRNCQEQTLSANEASVTVPIQDYLRPDKVIRWTDTAPCRAFVQTTNGSSAGQAVQHVTEAGRITYQLDATSNKSRIEPFRLNEPVDRNTGKLPGRLNVIYVVPTH